MATPIKRRVSTRILASGTPVGVSRVWSGRGGAHCSAGWLPTMILKEIGKLPTPRALKFVARKAGVPKVRAGKLYWDERHEQWWLVTNW